MSQEATLQLLAGILAAFVSPILTQLLKTVCRGGLRRFSPGINAGVSLALYITGWKLFSGDMGTLQTYMFAGLGSGVAGTLVYAAKERLSGEAPAEFDHAAEDLAVVAERALIAIGDKPDLQRVGDQLRQALATYRGH